MSRRPNVVVAVVVGLVAVLATVVVVLLDDRTPTKVDRNSPAGTVQAYLLAVLAGHSEEAAAHLATDSPCGVTDIDRADVDPSSRVVLVDTTTRGDRAWVDVRVSVTAEGSPFGIDTYREDHTYRLIRSGDRWTVLGTPWPLYACEGEAS